ncbi:AmmeMemoRadiSam system radical SAM enzyme [Pseudothermotoga thermarum]|uniref:Radical SAM domain protein n=1 Tax=Pseudothermotoga thermarum DSM 5069 TaxID=688269 RepID=F7YY85_9THEM|nr:AmmeMemoRadiSam system radical SAM enzyme [Pseudothermotoga thermarum]AEH50906.1 Radical SAM domain protein [Pseudothermotoga thermarum DSM 5069]
MDKTALYFSTLDKERVKCELCPHNCVLDNGQVGLCLARKNEDGVLLTLNYGLITSIAIDPIEKKPLFHLNPGEQILSVGTFGCNMKCPFCQNWEISQEIAPTRRITPEQLVSIAVSRKSRGIAYTYNEPFIWFEFVLDTSRIAAREGIYNVLVTNGMISEEPLHLLLQSIHAMNVDLKAFDEQLYKKLAGDLETVKRTIKLAVENSVHVEVTTLIVPGFNDDENMLEKEFQWLASLDKSIPLHLTRYFPSYKYNVPATPVEILVKFYNLAKKYLDFVYLGNVWDQNYESTFCPSCGTLVVKRVGYQVQVVGLDEEGRCAKCRRRIVRIL